MNKQVFITYKMRRDSHGMFEGVGSFKGLKGMLRGRQPQKTAKESLEEIEREARRCFSVPIDITFEQIPYEAQW